MLKLLIIIILCLYIAVLFFFYLNQRSFIYFPSKSASTPIKAGVPEMQVVSLTTKDGLALEAWYRPSLDSQTPTIVYFHGNAGHIGHRGPIVLPFLAKGYGVLLVTYRGYSGNPGYPSEKGFYQDARAAIQFLQEQNVPLHCVVLYGESIGTGVAVQMAAEYPIGALILQSPFTSLTDIAKLHYPFLPVNWLMKDQFNSLKKAKLIHAPSLVLYGQKDVLIPPSISLQLFEALDTIKEIQAIPQNDHNSPFNPHLTINFIQKHVSCHAKKE
jgi:fermentation-respiration switch protein FrsA (DUF1100 family)